VKTDLGTSTIVEQKQSNSKRYSVLLLDDEPDVTTVLKKGLEARAPFDVHAYNDPEDALKSFADIHYHMMIIDLRMPKMNGFEFYEKAQKLDEGAVIVFISTSETYYEEYIKRYPKWNGDCFIMKPISISHLAKFLLTEIS
jgi:two-component system, OmpR family, response regulator ChvI